MRNARIDIPGLLQHVIVRGIERRDIFLDDDDRHLFLDRLAKLLLETGTDCLAWALMSNHFHLLLRPRQTRLASFMRRLLTGYAVVFNLRHQRSGHLFQNRYKSIVCQEDLYLLELVRYIHLNPLRVGLVKSVEELETYPWSGHHVIMGKGNLDGQKPDEILSLFGRNRASARRAYREFVVDGIKKGRRDELVSWWAAACTGRQWGRNPEIGKPTTRESWEAANSLKACGRKQRLLLPSEGVSLLRNSFTGPRICLASRRNCFRKGPGRLILPGSGRRSVIWRRAGTASAALKWQQP